jgi:hypothetical protein
MMRVTPNPRDANSAFHMSPLMTPFEHFLRSHFLAADRTLLNRTALEDLA